MKSFHAWYAILILLQLSCKKPLTESKAVLNSNQSNTAVHEHVFVPSFTNIDVFDASTGKRTTYTNYAINGRKITQTPLFFDNNLIIAETDQVISATYPGASVNWQYAFAGSYKSPYTSALCTNGSAVFFSFAARTDSSGYYIDFIALDIHSGLLLWHNKTGITKEDFDGILGDDFNYGIAPTYYNNIVYFPVGNRMFALNASAGNVLWKHTTMREQRNPCVGDGKLFFVAGRAGYDKHDTLYALKASTGSLIWSQQVEMGWHAAPVYKNNHVYLNEYLFVHCLQAASGRSVWKRKQEANYGSLVPVFVTDTYVYASIQGYSYIYSIDAEKGTFKWQKRSEIITSDGLLMTALLPQKGKCFC